MNKQDIEDIYPLSHLQQGMLFHSLYSAHAGMYVEQSHCTIQGKLNTVAFQAAWQKVVERHTVLRTHFSWLRRDKPLQIVRKQAALPWQIHDWRGLPKQEQQQKFAALLVQDRERDFDLSKAPLLRLTLVQISATEYHFVWSHYHAILDGWSVSILFKEVIALYAALCRDQLGLLPASRSYGDYIAWQQKQNKAQAEQFWRKTLEGFSVPTPLPTLGKQVLQAASEEAAYAAEQHTIPQTTMLAVEELVKRQRITLGTLCQGIWALLLSRYGNQDDVLFGMTVSGRSIEMANIESMVGLFINTLPVRVKVPASLSLLDWLKQLQEQQLEMLQYTYVSLIDIQGWSNVPRNQSLFSSNIVIENYPLDPSLFAWGDDVELRDIHSIGRTNYPLAIEFTPGQTMKIQITYNTSIFTRRQISRLLDHLQVILEQIPVQLHQPLSALQIITQAELQQLLFDWNATDAAIPQDLCIHQLFEQQAQQTPGALAVADEKVRMTYAELNQQANQLAHHLRSLGIGSESFVGICLDRSPAMVVGLLAILKAGGVYVPLDPHYPQDRLSFMIHDTHMSVLITTQEFLINNQPGTLQVINLNALETSLKNYSTENLAEQISPEQLAYVIYTSGSTGRPKGVQVSHRNLVYSTSARFLYYREFVSGFLLLSSFSFDSSIAGIFWTLCQGGKLVLLAAEAQRDSARIAQILEQEQISHLLCVPSLYTLLLEDIAALSHNSLRVAIVAGEACPKELLERHAANLPSTRLFNEYGPTEGTVWCSVYDCAEQTDGESVSIGKPIANTRLYVLDPSWQLAPVGVRGELYVGGAGIARGYLEQPSLTAERFIPDPFSQQAGSRLYRTGDCVRYRENGTLEFLGRNDEQVKIRGYRIELGEIEAVIREFEGVREAATVVKTTEGNAPILVGYVVIQAGYELSQEELRRHLHQRLPEYMCPSVFVKLEALPLTPNGKVDRQQLPDPQTGTGLAVAERVAPRTPLEEQLALLWCELLGLSEVGVEENFFALGGHSLLITQLVARIRKIFALDVSVKALFHAATIADMAHVIENGMSPEIDVPPLQRSESRTNLPMSFAQQRLWFLHQLNADNEAYIIPTALRLTGKLQKEALTWSLNEIVRRHEVLRTRFELVNNQPVQILLPYQSFALEEVRLDHLPVEQHLLEIRRMALEYIQIPFDLSQGPLWRIVLLTISENAHVLLLMMHHTIFDGLSMHIFMHEFKALYQSYRSRHEYTILPDLPLQYADFAVWQRQWLQTAQKEAMLTYWKQVLADAPPLLELPLDHPRPMMQSFHGAAQSVAISQDLYHALSQLGRSEGATLFMVLLAAFKLLLFRYTAQTDLLVGAPIVERELPELEALIGCFVNTIVLRTQLVPTSTFRELLAQIRKVALDAYSHRNLPFELLVNELTIPRTTMYNPLFQVMFAFQQNHWQTDQIGEMRIEALPLDYGVAQFDLTLFIDETCSGLDCALTYNTDLFEAATITQMLSHFHQLLEGIVASPQQQLGAYQMLSPQEVRQLVTHWNATERWYPPKGFVHTLFEMQVERTPDAVAVVCGDELLTYTELNCRANQLAHHLQTCGIGPEMRVGIYLRPSLEVLLALLAVCKAGGAYVPLDWQYPAERLRFIVSDAQLSLVLSEQALIETQPFQNTRSLCIDRAWSTIAHEDRANLPCIVQPDNLVYIIYTSGSTGQPKGVMITHGGLSNYLRWTLQVYPVTEGSCSPVHSSLGFDLTVTSLYPSLLVGGKVLFLGEDEGIDVLSTVLPEQGKMSLVKLTPAHLEILHHCLDADAMRSIDSLVIGGEMLLGEHLAAWHTQAPQTRLINEYGPTETVVGCSVFEQLTQAPLSTIIPIGRPIANTRLYVLDQQWQLVPVGVRGELYIGGTGVARGYLDRADLTAERFIPDPFSKQAGTRLYRTGDCVRYRKDGCLEFLGRNDEQVKLRGYRIELGEIEAVMRDFEGIREAVAQVGTTEGNTQVLVGYIVAQAGYDLHQEELKSHLRQRLPEYMCPSILIQLEELPLTPNGKVARQQLPVPQTLSVSAITEGTAPSTPIEEQLARIWQNVLGVASINVESSFFDLGGDSIRSIQVVVQARALGLSLTARDLFHAPTIAQLAQVVQQASQQVQRTVQSEPEPGPVPLTPIQHWFVQLTTPLPQHWNQSLLLRIRGPVQQHQLQTALNWLPRQHAALRLRVHQQTNGHWVQYYAQQEVDVPLQVIRIPSRVEAEAEVVLEQEAEQLQRKLDLQQGPLLRALLLEVDGQQESWLQLIAHHWTIDAVSWRFVLEDLELAYTQLERGERVRLAPRSSSYQAWGRFLQQYRQSNRLQEQRDYWRQVISRPQQAWPVEQARGSRKEETIETIQQWLSQEQTHQLQEEVLPQYRCQLQEVLLSAVVAMSLQWSVQGAERQAAWQEGAVGIDLEGHGREELSEQVDVARTVGWFTSLYPVRIEVPATLAQGIVGGCGKMGEVLKLVKEQLREVPEHGIGYGILRYLSEQEAESEEWRGEQTAPVLLNYLGHLQEEGTGGWVRSVQGGKGKERDEQAERAYEIEINAWIEQGRICLNWSYSQQRYRRKSIEQMGQWVQEALQDLIDMPPASQVQTYTPSDFPKMKFDTLGFDNLLAKLSAVVEDE